MNAPARKFDAKPAVRGDDPLLIGMIGPPGGGKTFSALRVAAGMKQVRKGPIVLIDTEGGRAKKYASDFEFLHVLFNPPFKPSDFLAAIEQQLELKPSAIIVDSLSDEHEGDGGVLDWQAHEADRMAGGDFAKRDRVSQAAWIKPKRDRVKMMNGLLRITVPLIFTFRAREKTKQIKNAAGKIEPVNIGYQPIAPNEIVYGIDLTCILPPRAEGVPVWKSDKIGEDFIIKLPKYLKPFIAEGHAMSEDMGRAFATWARGGPATPQTPYAAGRPVSSVPLQDQQDQAGETGARDLLTQLDDGLAQAATKGTKALEEEWRSIHPKHQKQLEAALRRRHKPTAVAVDQENLPDEEPL